MKKETFLEMVLRTIAEWKEKESIPSEKAKIDYLVEIEKKFYKKHKNTAKTPPHDSREVN